MRGRTDLKPASVDESNRTVWENDPVSVPIGTAINFDVGFVIDGRSHLTTITDSITWSPIDPNAVELLK
jgi:hypothetical protein